MIGVIDLNIDLPVQNFVFNFVDIFLNISILWAIFEGVAFWAGLWLLSSLWANLMIAGLKLDTRYKLLLWKSLMHTLATKI